jgi:hypothetical protein
MQRNEKVPLEPLVPDRQVTIGSELSQEEEENLINFLRSNNDVFAWSSNDLVGINRDIIEHKLDIDPSFRPKKQKLWKLSKDNAQAAKAELQRLLNSKDCWTPKMADQYSHGEVEEWKVAHVYRFH